MDIFEVLQQRRSIRKYADMLISKEQVEVVLSAAALAPSSKNRQPWRFVVVQGEEKQGMLRAMADGIRREETGQAGLPGSKGYIAGAKKTLEVMEEAPVTVFVLNPLEKALRLPAGFEEWCYHAANLQSIGAAIENMHLAATAFGLGGLWICDIFFAYRELQHWLETEDQLVAAFSLGVPGEQPPARPRKRLEELVEWRG